MNVDRRRTVPTVLTVLRVVAVVRWILLAWMVGIVVVAGGDDALRVPAAAWAAVIVVFCAAGYATWALRRRPDVLLSPRYAASEALIAFALSAIDGWVFEPGHVFATSQSLATQYPLIAMVSVGFSLGPIVAAAIGLSIGPAEWIAVELNDFGPLEPRHVVSLAASSLFFAAAGAVFGWLGDLLRRVEAEIADRRARDEVAREMHDTVLQVFTAVERRTHDSDPELARSVRVADRELRDYLFGTSHRPDHDFEAMVRARVARAVGAADIRATVNVLADDETPRDEIQRAIVGAIGEAVSNAVKHADASTLTIFVDVASDGAVYASVRDDGSGFEPDNVAGDGITSSIVGRLAAVGGRTEIDSADGSGTEVQLWAK